jgi:outer membrane lipoprotein-sorting protein
MRAKSAICRKKREAFRMARPRPHSLLATRGRLGMTSRLSFLTIPLMAHLCRWLALDIAVVMLAACAVAQEGPLKNEPPSGITPEQIIQKFTTKEKEFKNARKRCTYRQTIKLQAAQGDSVSEYDQVADVSLDSSGNKVKSIVFAPQSSIPMSPEDTADVESRLYFTLSTDELPEYTVRYKGQQQQDDLHCYVFDVKPTTIEKNKRYFEGTIWVDDHDFQIVRMAGKSAPDILPKKKKDPTNLFPKFTTYRQIMDGQYWYPTYSLTDDTLHFPGADVQLKGTVKASNFKCASPVTETGKGSAPKKSAR